MSAENPTQTQPPAAGSPKQPAVPEAAAKADAKPETKPEAKAEKAAAGKKAAPEKKKAPEVHELQFMLLDAENKPITPPRKYTLSWTDSGATEPTSREGTTDARGLTELVKTKGQVRVELSVAPLEGDECRVVGAVKSRLPKEGVRPRVAVTLEAPKAAAAAKPKPNNHCAEVKLREGKQQIRFTIKNVSRWGQYTNRLQQLPYLVIDYNTGEVLSNEDPTDTDAKAMSGSVTEVKTGVFACDGVKEVAIILGNSTDDPAYWRSHMEAVAIYRTVPLPQGVTEVVITEVAQRQNNPKIADRSENGKGILDGTVWHKRIARDFNVEDVRIYCPDPMQFATKHPTEKQLADAVANKKLTAEEASLWRSGKQPEGASVELSYPWDQILRHIYQATVVETENPTVDPVMEDLVEVKGKKKVKVIDPETGKPKRVVNVKETEAAQNARNKLIASGSGYVNIPELNLKVRLSGGASPPGEPMGENAYAVAGLHKTETLRKTHPYAYAALFQVCADIGVNEVVVGSTWRPMIGSVLHKLGDGLDFNFIDDYEDKDAKGKSIPGFRYVNQSVTAGSLAGRFNAALKKHPWVRSNQIFYNLDSVTPLATAAYHDNHVHLTGDRIGAAKAVAARKKQ